MSIYKKLIPITFILSLILLIVSAIIPITCDITDIPLVSWAIEEDTKDSLNEVTEAFEELEVHHHTYADELTKSQERAYDKVLDKAEKLVDKFSLLNLRNVIISVDEFAEEVEDIADVEEDLPEIEEYKKFSNILIIGVLGLFVLPLIFTLLGGLLKSKGLTITALVLVILPQLALSGILFVVLSFVIYITQAVFCGKAKKQATQLATES